MDKCDLLLRWMHENRNQRNIDGMSRFGICTQNALGIPMPALRAQARKYRPDHELALALWESGIHEARIMASLIADPLRMTPAQTDRWTAEFDSWDVCDQCCMNLFRYLPYADEKVREYALSSEEFVRRAAFALIAALAAGSGRTDEDVFVFYLSLARQWSRDERNFVRKAVSWAVRQIGKRSFALREAAIETGRLMAADDVRCARWIGKDVLRELTADKTADIIRRREKRTKLSK